MYYPLLIRSTNSSGVSISIFEKPNHFLPKSFMDAPSFLFNYVYACWANMYDKYLCFHLIIVLLCARGTGCQTSWGNGQFCFLVLLTLNEI